MPKGIRTGISCIILSQLMRSKARKQRNKKRKTPVFTIYLPLFFTITDNAPFWVKGNCKRAKYPNFLTLKLLIFSLFSLIFFRILSFMSFVSL